MATLTALIVNYNHGRYLKGCLDAVFGQSRPPDQVVIVDDASTDDSAAIIAQFAHEPRVVVIQHEKNSGVVQSLNDGLARCTMDYVACLAADDLILKGLFEKSLAILEGNPQAGLCSALAGIIDADGRDMGDYHTPVVRLRPAYLTPDEFLEEFILHGSWVLTYSAIYRRAAIAEIGGFLPELGPTSDGYIIQMIGARYGSCFIPEKLVLWRRLLTGYSYSTGQDNDSALSRIELLTQKLVESKLPVFPKRYVDAFLRRSYENALIFMADQKPFPIAAALRAAYAIPAWSPLLSAYQSALKFGGGRVATKIYIYIRHSPGERRRIALDKFQRLLIG